MSWVYTLVRASTKHISAGEYLCKTNTTPGIKDIRNGICLAVSVIAIQNIATAHGKSPIAMSPQDIKSYIYEYFYNEEYQHDN